MRSSRLGGARFGGALGIALFGAAVGCSRILGLQTSAPVECLHDEDCVGPADHCISATHTCSSLAGESGSAAAPGDAAPVAIEADAPVPDATAPEAAAAETGPIIALADATDDMSDGCGLASGVCVACPGIGCAVARPGWSTPVATEFAQIGANMFDAVPIDIPNPSWLMQLGVDATNTNATGRLGLYKDLAGQPGDLVAQTGVTIAYDAASHGTEVTVSDLLLCLLLDEEHYWVGAVFDSPVYLLSNGTGNTLRYEGAFPDGGSLAGPVSGTNAFGLQRNLYVVVTTQSQPPQP